MISRRLFVQSLALGALAPVRLHAAPQGRTSMYLAFTSFAVRMLQGRDIMKTSASALNPQTFLELCRRFGASGAQIDFSQVPVDNMSSLAAIRQAYERAGIEVEVSIPTRYLETPEAFAQAASIAAALGAKRARVALLSGRRYETFDTRAAWDAFADKWRETLPRLRAEFNKQRLPIGIENHKDWLAPELVALLKSIDSPFVGACVDFGNNIALLEDPDETMELLTPYAITTHLKDMAIRRTELGFELSEVPLGQGFLPLESYVTALRRTKPDVPLCLEMITRDPLIVPYKTDKFWVAFDASSRDASHIRRFEDRVLGKQTDRPLQRTTGVAAEQQLTAEDENVRASVEYAITVLKLGAH
jgi:3-oxoisoapionate decarboxylase